MIFISHFTALMRMWFKCVRLPQHSLYRFVNLFNISNHIDARSHRSLNVCVCACVDNKRIKRNFCVSFRIIIISHLSVNASSMRSERVGSHWCEKKTGQPSLTLTLHWMLMALGAIPFSLSFHVSIFRSFDVNENNWPWPLSSIEKRLNVSINERFERDVQYGFMDGVSCH